MAGKLCQTASYIWFTKDVLGQGATSGVYRGRHKKTGEMVAVKMFNKASYMRPREVQERELEMMGRLNHENIVRLLKIEQEATTRNDVIIMELCAGGSLYNVLEKPENYYGLEETEFLRFVKDLIAGIRYLREQAIIHRDLKPGNIMRAVNEDGSYTYKLTDFGAARELLPDENFVSVYGTEEYLHPEMYERAVLRVNRQQTFDSTVDLWSIGVTMYHAATGTLPFRPYGGRNNRETMHIIISSKRSGMISGVQKREGGDIEWSDKLPIACQLSPCLAADFEGLLRQVLETDKSRMMTFDLFIRVCEEIVSKRCIHVFSMRSSMSDRIYISPTKMFHEFVAEVERAIGVPAKEQEYFFNYSPFKEVDYPTVSTFPLTKEDNPLIVYGGDYAKLPLRHLYLPKVPQSSQTSQIDLTADDHMAKAFVGLCHQFKRITHQIYTISKLIEMSFETIRRQIQHEWFSVQEQTKLIDAQCRSVQVRCDILLQSHDSEMPMLRLLLSTSSCDTSLDEKTLSEWAELKKSQRDSLEATHRYIQSSSVNPLVLLCDKWRKDYDEHFQKLNKCEALIGQLLKGVGEIRDVFHRERKQGRITYQDEHNHVFERKRLQEMCKHGSVKVESYIRARESLHEHLANWARHVHHHRLSLVQTQKDLDGKLVAFQRFDRDLESWQENRQKIVKKLISMTESSRGQDGKVKSYRGGKNLMAELQSAIKELKRGNENNYIEVSKQQEMLRHLSANVSDLKGFPTEDSSEDS